MTVAAAGLVLAAACTAAPEPDARTKTAWADRVCGVVVAAEAALAAPPPALDPADPAALRTALSGYLGGLSDSLSTAVSAFSSLRPAPIEGGDRIVQIAEETYRGLRAPLSEAKTALDGSTAPDVVAQAVAEVAPKLAALDLTQPLAGTAGTEFTRWAESAPQCARLPSLRG
ncbi:hypothetical protein [Actinokineospora sp. NBRC 105648]|uniref:hypothetical protein n=1 Tax=Actinokineospora sp. NBRC 105648 TaxID=3032206 RepID=UPI0024A20FBE|nr:hypothetical protein [Actinokineospora sp. NBRC 105648]GLZ40311.1 hypothetical protein Acsp05_39350 [Actinokineospora sp. NBRC 105648]